MALVAMLGSLSARAVPPWVEQAKVADISSEDAVAIYRRGSDGTWALEQTITVGARNTRSVAVSTDPVLGELVIFGSVQEQNFSPQILGGSVYAYASDGSGSGSMQKTLRPTALGVKHD